jgi:CheY-like chemotaxis protein
VPNFDQSIVGKRCLVLEDEFLIALDMQQILETAGAKTVTCFGNSADCAAALQLGRQFDVAVLDFKLSDSRDSLSIAALLKQQGTPFVFVTGMRSKDVKSAEFPDAPFVEKPYEAPSLLEALRRALGAR